MSPAGSAVEGPAKGGCGGDRAGAGSDGSTLRPLRSVLYMPGANARALEKAQGLPADGLIFDLEDAVAPDAKEQARRRVTEAAASGAYGSRTVTIRVNGLDTRWYADDIATAATGHPDAVLVPKVSSAADVRTIIADLDAVPDSAGIELWAMIETPLAVLNIVEICRASDRLTTLVMGTNDLINELHAEHVPGREPVLPSLHAVLIAARATGKAVLDGVYNAVTDLEGFTTETVQSRQLGFDGRTLIHPGQIEPCNEIFAPDEQALTDARKVMDAWRQAQEQNLGVVTVDGKMVENLHVRNAERLLALDEAIRGRA